MQRACLLKPLRRWGSFSATNEVKAHLRQTEHPNTLPASEVLSRSTKERPGRFFHSVLSSSFSVMDATAPAMSPPITRPCRVASIHKLARERGNRAAFFVAAAILAASEPWLPARRKKDGQVERLENFPPRQCRSCVFPGGWKPALTVRQGCLPPQVSISVQHFQKH